jgi:predicted RND superfamily exporter protein
MTSHPIIEQIVRRRRLVIAIIVLLTALAIPFASRVGFESSIDIWFLDDDESLVRYREFQNTFGGDEVVVIPPWTT